MKVKGCVSRSCCSMLLGCFIEVLTAGCSKSDVSADDLGASDLTMVSPADLAVAPPHVLGGFKYPAGIAWDPGSSSWYVSNRLSAPVGVPVKSGAAYLSRIPADLSKVELIWLGGLNAPSGLAALNGKLYVVDADEVVTIDLASKMVQRRTAIPGVAAYLTGLAIDSGAGKAYVSDSVGNQIFSYNLTTAATALLVKSPSLASPQGLYVNAPSLIALSYGSGSGDGVLWSIDLGTTGQRTLGTFSGNLAGLNYDPGNRCYLISDFKISVVWRVDTMGARAVTARNFYPDGLKSVAGVGFDPVGSQLGVTDPTGSQVAIFKLPSRDAFW